MKKEIFFSSEEMKYLKLLSKNFPNIQKASSEIINLQAILNLPKGTEHFLSDIHGEYEPFIHVLKNASGVIRQKISDIFGFSLTESEKKSLATLIYYPEEKLDLILQNEKDVRSYYEKTLYQLVEVCRVVSSKYTRSKVRKSLPPDFAYIIEELLHEQGNRTNKQEYYTGIIRTIIDIDRAKYFVIALSNLIQRLAVDRLHILGDIFDRGPGADIIMDSLITHHSVDFQWGNHDILWMGAAAGNLACIANVIRICLRYGNTDTLEIGYGINLLPLVGLSMDFYRDFKSEKFKPKISPNEKISQKDIELMTKMHLAITIIQLKLEGQIIKKRKEFEMSDRLLLDKINFDNYSINIEGVSYPLNTNFFPTVDKNNPYELNEEEKKSIEKLRSFFVKSEKLQKHINFLYSKGSLYLKYNSNLLFHGCIPMTNEGKFENVKIDDKEYSGKKLMDKFDKVTREAFFSIDPEVKTNSQELVWYLWQGPNSPLFGKKKMTTFERYFIDDPETHKEQKNPFYNFRDDENTCKEILKDFELPVEDSHIISGHIPVKVKLGESPIKANGKLFVIDGGFSKAYQKETGIAGYTLIYNSYGLQLVSHESFGSTQEAIENEKDILTLKTVLEHSAKRKTIADTDVGKEITEQIEDLKKLVIAYREGFIAIERSF